MKIRAKIVICMIWLLSLAFGIGGSLIISISFANSYERELDYAVSMFSNTEYAMYYVVEENVVSDPMSFFDRFVFGGMLNADAIRVYIDDGILIESYGSIDDTPKTAENGSVELYSDGNGRKYIRIADEIVSTEGTIKLVAYYNITPIYLTRAAQYSIYKKVFAATIFIAAALSYLIAYLLTKPLEKLKGATKRLAEGEMDYRADINNSDEIGELARDFNSMADKLEENIAELQDSVHRQEEFMASFAHEMKTPMTSIIGYADLLRSQSLDAEEQMNAASYIFSEGKRLESLSFKLLDLIATKNGMPDMKLTNPAVIVSQLVESLKTVFAEQNVILQYKCEDGACLMDADLVKSLLVNLIDNSRKAFENGGNIFISSKMTDSGCEIKVHDNGPGIPEDALSHLTEAFYRVDKSRSRSQGGAGLGLNLCSEIVKLHNGEMTIESRVGNGTCVTVSLNGGAV